MRTIATFCAAALVLASATAQAATPCLTPAEASSLAAYALPAVISGATKRCAPTLASSAFLPKGGTQLAARYAARKAQSWPAAKAAFLKMGGKDDASAMLAGLPDPSLQQMLDAVIEGKVAQEIPTERCATIDRVIGLLAPLPAQNTAELIALAMGITGKSGGTKTSAFAICKS